MILQCFDCTKKYSINAENIPPEGVFATCAGCGQKLRIAPRDNVETDRTGLPKPKQKQASEVKWNNRVLDSIKGWGYKKGTKETNVLYHVFRGFRKKFGATFFDTACRLEVEYVDRELIYNRMRFVGDACIPATYEEMVSRLPKMLHTLAEAVRLHDAGLYTVPDVLRIPYRDSFPTMFVFSSEAVFQNAEGDQVKGMVSEVALDVDTLKTITDEPGEADIPSFARVVMSRAPIEADEMLFKDRIRPGLSLNTQAAPGLKLGDQAVDSLINEYARHVK